MTSEAGRSLSSNEGTSMSGDRHRRTTWKPGHRHFVEQVPNTQTMYRCLDCLYVGPWPSDNEACPGPVQGRTTSSGWFAVSVCPRCGGDQDNPNNDCPSWERGMGLHPREGIPCPRCDTDTHRCRGCGEPTEHSTKDVCVRCRNTL